MRHTTSPLIRQGPLHSRRATGPLSTSGDGERAGCEGRGGVLLAVVSVDLGVVADLHADELTALHVLLDGTFTVPERKPRRTVDLGR